MKPSTLIIVIIVLLIPIGIFIAMPKKDTSTTTNSTTSTPSMTPTPSSSTSTAPADAVSAHKVILKTAKGNITLDLYPEDAPLAVQNFVTLGKRGYYDNVIFHRVIKGFMDQAGDPTGTGTGGQSIYGQVFKTEITKYQFVKGTLGVARTSQMDTNGSQFFIMAADTHSLDGQYTAFGKVDDAASQAVVDAINSVQTDSSDKPVQDVKITGFEIVQQ